MIRNTLQKVCSKQNLTLEEAQNVFAHVMQGLVNEVELSALLIALKTKGESPDEIAGAAQAMRSAAHPFNAQGLEVVDSCGTGGDGMSTVNISTAAALVAAEAGLHVAKHGNRAVSSRCGSADVLEACGVQIDTPVEYSERALRDVGICFLFAPHFHPGVRHAMSVRKQLGVRTMFNLLGPLANPAKPRFQVLGVYDPALCRTMAETLALLGCERALVVHGGGLDEIALHSETRAAFLDNGQVSELVLSPESVGFKRCAPEALQGGDPAENASWLMSLLAGNASHAHTQAVALNAGALLWIAGRAEDLGSGCRLAIESIQSGKAVDRLAQWAYLTQDK